MKNPRSNLSAQITDTRLLREVGYLSISLILINLLRLIQMMLDRFEYYYSFMNFTTLLLFPQTKSDKHANHMSRSVGVDLYSGSRFYNQPMPNPPSPQAMNKSPLLINFSAQITDTRLLGEVGCLASL
jgi:hypothetical protein